MVLVRLRPVSKDSIGEAGSCPWLPFSSQKASNPRSTKNWGVCLVLIFKRGWTKGGQCSPHSRRCSSHTPPRWEITTRSGGPRCRMGSGVSLVSPRGMTLSSCHPARPWPSISHDRTSELLASPGWALTAASCSLMSRCPSAVGFSEPLSALHAPQWSRVAGT